ncbi:MAG: ROK family protein [Proteobacteria bacterium]|nr:ROK family protein [Pseudomonadota bacterium]
MKIGIDLGGTKIEVIALDDDGLELFRKRIPTPVPYDEKLAAIAQLVIDAEQAVQQTCSVGIGTPGSISAHTGLMQNAENLVGRSLDKDLELALKRPIRMANDANCFALSEAIDGAGAGHEAVFGVILGTGVGGGLVINGHVRTGPNAIAGEWGHNPLPSPADSERPGPNCYCGRLGCIETFLNGRGLERAYKTVAGENLSAEEVAAGDSPEKTQALTLYEDRLSRSLAGIVNIIDPDVIVLGGGVSNVDRLYSNVPKIMPNYVFASMATTPIKKARFGDSSGIRGAAWLWND